MPCGGEFGSRLQLKKMKLLDYFENWIQKEEFVYLEEFVKVVIDKLGVNGKILFRRFN